MTATVERSGCPMHRIHTFKTATHANKNNNLKMKFTISIERIIFNFVKLLLFWGIKTECLGIC